jgi:hypothetical protein
MVSVPVQPKHEKYRVDVSRPGRTKMYYVAHRSHWMQKYMFGVTCHGAFFVESILVPPEHEK